MKAVWLAALVFSAACAGDVTSPDQQQPGDTTHDVTVVDGPLKFEVRDFLASPGFLWALPSVIGGTGNVVIQNTRYGSLCSQDVSGTVDQRDKTVTLHVVFTERLTVCTAEIRALQYTATITEPGGIYNVLVVHHENNRTDTLQKQTIVVR